MHAVLAVAEVDSNHSGELRSSILASLKAAGQGGMVGSSDRVHACVMSQEAVKYTVRSVTQAASCRLNTNMTVHCDHKTDWCCSPQRARTYMALLTRATSHRLQFTAIPSLPTNDTIQLVPINSNDLELGAADSNDAFTGVANIVVPAHVLELFVGRHAWDPDPERQRQVSKNRTDSRRSFDAASIARDQHAAVERIHARASSIAIGALARSRDVGDDSRANPFTVAGPRELLRKTSLPTLREQASSATLGSSSTQGSSVAARSSWHTSKSRKTHGKRPDSDIYNALMTFPGELSGDSILFQKLCSYDLNRANKNRIFDEKSPFDCSNYIIGDSPFEDPAYVVPNEKTESIYGTGIGPLKSRMSIGLERRGTVLSRIRRNSVLHATTEAITNVTDTAVAGLADAARRTSLANLYEQDKTKGQTFQRKEWAQTVFEYTIYLILILFIYFVLVGVPLWKGAVWWLYWVVGNVSTEYDEGGTSLSTAGM